MATALPTDDAPRLHIAPIGRWNLALAAVAVAGAALLASPVAALAVALGAAVGTANLRLLEAASRHFFSGRLGGGGVWVALFFLRFVALAVAIWAGFAAGLHPLGFVAGLVVHVPAVLVGAWRMRPPAGEPAPTPAADDAEWERWDPWLARERDDDEDAG